MLHEDALRALRENDEEALYVHFVRLTKFVWDRNPKFSQRLDYEDAAASAVAACFRRISTYDSERSRPSVYFTTAIFYELHNLWTRAGYKIRFPKAANMGDDIEHYDCPDDAPSPLEAAIVSEECELVEERMRRLTDREQLVIRLRFWRKRTLAQIGRQIGVSPERVRQIEKRALEKMR